MILKQPLDDEMFINSNFLANGPIQEAESQDQYDPSSFFRIGSITGRCAAEYRASQATTGCVFRNEGTSSTKSEGAGPGVW
jgi:hypothetical protein